MEIVAPVTIDYDSAESCRPLSEVPWASEFPPIEPGWRSESVIGLAAAIRETEDLSRLPILADALQENGCENPFVLDHCRRCELHIRECWLVSAILEQRMEVDSKLAGTLVFDHSLDQQEWQRYDAESPLIQTQKAFEPLGRLFDYLFILLLASIVIFFLGFGFMILWRLII